MSDLPIFLDAWRSNSRDLLRLLTELEPHDWERPTDCPGWSVRDVVAHLAALEHEMATGRGPGPVGDGAREVVSTYTAAGVDERRGRTPNELLTELESAIDERGEQLARLAPSDPSGTPDRTPGGIAWDWQTLLRNRVVDLWVHEQDIRRATNRPGGMHSPSADIVATTFASALPFVIGKRAGAAPGSTVVVQIDGRTTAYSVDESGRCRLTDAAPQPTATLTMDRETFTVLAAGRREPGSRQVTVSGDARLAESILRSLALTP